MPNITPEEQMVKYNLYDRKTSLPDGPMSVDEMDGRKIVIGYGRWGDSKHFGKQISGEFVQRICETVEYQASYVQQLAYSVLLLSDKEVTEESFGMAVNDLLAQNSNVFIEQTQSLTTYQLNFLRAVMDGVSSGFGEASVRERYNLGSTSNITRLKKSMIDKELVELTPKGIILGDPVLKLWLKRVISL